MMRTTFLRFLVLVVLSFALIAHSGECEYTDNELQTNREPRESLNGQLYQDYMKNNEFLFPWLKGIKLKHEYYAAHEMITQSLKWRKENNIDSLLDEGDDLKCDTYHSFLSDTVDKAGRPVIFVRIGEWDVRKQMLAGKSEQFVRCSFRLIEHGIFRARRQVQNDPAANASLSHYQFDFIVDFQGFNLRQHACATCIPTYVIAVVGYEMNYPLSISKFIVLKTPRIFETAVSIALGAFSRQTRDIILYGFEENQWKEALLNEIASDQLSPMYVGPRTNRGPWGKGAHIIAILLLCEKSQIIKRCVNSSK